LAKKDIKDKDIEQIQYKEVVMCHITENTGDTKDYFYELHGFLGKYGHYMSAFVSPKWSNKGRDYKESYHLHGATIEVTAIDRNRAPKRGYSKHWVDVVLASDKSLDKLVEYMTDSFPDLKLARKNY
jgi:hypothetical protein